MSLKIYQYSGCSACKKALKFLDNAKIAYETVAIRETPPTIAELSLALDSVGGNVRKLYNTSGQEYRRLGMKDRLESMDLDESLAALANNGSLVKRPLALGDGWALVGFREAEWSARFR